MHNIKTSIAVFAGLAFLLASPILLADMPQPEPPDPPHSQDDTCTVENNETDDIECVSCAIPHNEWDAEYEFCDDTYKPMGYARECGSEWTEIWCREKETDGDAGADSDADGGVSEWDDNPGSCSTAMRRNRSFPAQLGLVFGLIVFGLLARRRSR
ncbi:MAG: hypothetical protein GY854_22305 [Deltaproteobacteria bacterium]|nr:hypothetical protein [Deltaproteobacteria bacterium]